MHEQIEERLKIAIDLINKKIDSYKQYNYLDEKI
jgi:predicted HTH domain antitoxin